MFFYEPVDERTANGPRTQQSNTYGVHAGDDSRRWLTLRVSLQFSCASNSGSCPTLRTQGSQARKPGTPTRGSLPGGC
jgi:hypothetical protein